MAVWTYSRLKHHQYANCHIETNEEGEMNFVSYSTTVLMVRNRSILCTGTYSQTTAKQIGWFLRENFPTLSYFDMKCIAGTGKWLDIDTHILKDRAEGNPWGPWEAEC